MLLATSSARSRMRAHTRKASRSCRGRGGGAFSDYEVVGGVRVPTQAEVRWQLPEGPFTYWRATITSLELVQ
jgi:hypothetical protein